MCTFIAVVKENVRNVQNNFWHVEKEKKENLK